MSEREDGRGWRHDGGVRRGEKVDEEDKNDIKRPMLFRIHVLRSRKRITCTEIADPSRMLPPRPILAFLR